MPPRLRRVLLIRRAYTGRMLGASSGTATTVVLLGASLLGPVLAIAIYWFGIRSARRHDQAHPQSPPPPQD
jgi:hypothetical protein